MIPDFLLEDWENLVQIALTVPVLYIAVIASIRITGKRSTSQMNNFDWIVTVAIGSLVGSGVILEGVTVLETLLAIGLMLLCQYLTTSMIQRSERVAGFVKAEPALLLHKGELLRVAMRRERVTEAEVMAALRSNGIWRAEDAAWVTLETNATLSVIPRTDETTLSEATALSGVTGKPHDSGG